MYETLFWKLKTRPLLPTHLTRTCTYKVTITPRVGDDGEFSFINKDKDCNALAHYIAQWAFFFVIRLDFHL